MSADIQWEAVYKLATDQTAPPDQRNAALRSLGRSEDPELIQRNLQVALNEVKKQDAYIVLHG
jgi:hypothetical protein